MLLSYSRRRFRRLGRSGGLLVGFRSLGAWRLSKCWAVFRPTLAIVVSIPVALITHRATVTIAVTVDRRNDAFGQQVPQHVFRDDQGRLEGRGRRRLHL